jgi:ABC-2 type transport system permease protein
VSRDIKSRYKRSALGIAWTMLNPLMMMVVLTLVFSSVFRQWEVHHYPVYLLSAMVLWNFFTQSTTAAMSQLLWGGALLGKIYVPKAIFPLAAIGTGLVNLVIALVPLMAIMLVVGVWPSWAMLFLPVPIVLAAMFALGLGLALSTLAVVFSDVVDMYQIVLSAWFFLTPIIYPETIVPEGERLWMYLNPMYYLVNLFRQPIYEGTLADPMTLAVATVVSVATLALGWLLFTGRIDDMAYRL